MDSNSPESTEVYARFQNLPYDDSEWTPDELRRQLARAAVGNGKPAP